MDRKRASARPEVSQYGIDILNKAAAIRLINRSADLQPGDFARLNAFVAVAERGSFVKAANLLGLSTSTISHSVRTLEEFLGVRLLNRTTRSVALTDAGGRLLERIQPALRELRGAIEDLHTFKEVPAGPLRLSVSSLALSMVVAPALHRFLAAYPAITVDVAVNDDAADLVDGTVHAGIRGPSRIPQDMVAVRLTPPSRKIAIASPDYLERNGRPRTPAALAEHNCVQFRLTNGGIYRWEFEQNRRRIVAPVFGSLVTDNMDLVLRAAVEGVGIGYTIEAHAERFLRSGQVVPVLEDYAAPFAGWFIYYPSRRQVPLPLKVFTAFLKKLGRARAQVRAPEVEADGFGPAAIPALPAQATAG